MSRNANSKMSDARVAVVLDALRAGNTRTNAAAYAEIDRRTFYNWLEANATFLHNVEKAEADAEARAVAIVIRSAQGGTWQAAAWWLERRRQDVYALRQKVEMSGPDGGPIKTEEVTLNDHERATLREALDVYLAEREPA